jgi:hypothetical protein
MKYLTQCQLTSFSNIGIGKTLIKVLSEIQSYILKARKGYFYAPLLLRKIVKSPVLRQGSYKESRYVVSTTSSQVDCNG